MSRFAIGMSAYAACALALITGMVVRGCAQCEYEGRIDAERRSRCAHIVQVYPSGWFCAEDR